MMKISADVLKQLNKLPAKRRARAEAIVRRHVEACFRLGFPPDNLERVYIEAIEMSGEIEEPASAVAPVGVVRSYAEQYRTPIDAQPVRAR